MTVEKESFCQWFSRKRREYLPHISQQEVARRASAFVPMSQTYVSLIERTAGSRNEPDVSPERIIALAHALGAKPREALALRANVISADSMPSDEEFPLPSGGSIVLRGRSGTALTSSEQALLTSVVDALLRTYHVRSGRPSSLHAVNGP